MATATHEPKRSKSFGLLMLALIAAEFTSAFESTMIYTTMKAFITTFGDPVGAGWLLTAYLLVAAAAAAIGGRLGDIFGRRKVLLIALALAALGSLISATADGLLQVVIGRAIQGFAGAILPLCYGLVRENLPEEKVPFAAGLLGISAVVATGFGIITGGILIDNFDWHSIFIASGTLALISFLLCWGILSPSQPQPRTAPLDLMGGLLFVPAIFLLLIGITMINSRGVGLSSPTLPLLAGGLVLLLIWVRHELRTEYPLIDLRLLTVRNVALANVAMCCFSLAPQQGQFMSLLFQQPTATGAGLGVSATQAGLYNMPGFVVAMMLSPLVAIALTRFGSRAVLILAGIGFLSGMLMLYWALFFGSVVAMVLMFILAGVGSVALFASAPNFVIAATPPERTSEATGMLQVIRTLFQAIGAQILATLLATSTTNDPITGAGPFPTFDAYVLTITVAVVLSSGTLIAGLLIRSPKKDVSAN